MTGVLPTFRSRLSLRKLAFSAALAAVLAQPLAAFAQAYPARPIRLVHGFSPGAAIDVFSRPVAQKLSEALGQSVVVDSRPGATSVADTMAGRVDMMWDSLGVVRPYVQAGKLRVIGTTGARRAAALPDVATLEESGLRGYQISGWHGFFGPPGMARDIVTTLNTTIAKILATPDMKDLWGTLAMEIIPNTPEQFAARVRADYERYGKLIKSIGLKPQIRRAGGGS